MEENNLGPFDWYRALTVEQMREALIKMVNGQYFEDEKQYAFLNTGGDLVVRTGKELNDQIPEGYDVEELMTFSDDTIVRRYVSDIKTYVEYDKEVDGFSIKEDGLEFAKNYLDLLDQMNQVVYIPPGPTSREEIERGLDYQDGMLHATEIQTGYIGDVTQTGFKDHDEFYKWYLKDVAPFQSVLQPGQTQAEDLSIVGKDFYNKELTQPNSRFPRKPEAEEGVVVSEENTMVDTTETEEVQPKFRDTSDLKFNKYMRPGSYALNPNLQNLPPETNPMQNGQDYFNMLADLRRMKPKETQVVKEKMKPEKRRFF